MRGGKPGGASTHLRGLHLVFFWWSRFKGLDMGLENIPLGVSSVSYTQGVSTDGRLSDWIWDLGYRETAGASLDVWEP